MDKEFSKLVLCKYYLKQVDTLLYDVGRDHRVSGHPVDNTAMKREVQTCKRIICTLNSKLSDIWREADKSPVTGE